MFHISYCGYNHSNPDYDRIDRPFGSGDYLLLYFMTPMRVQMGTETLVTKEGAFLLYTPGAAQIYQAVKHFKNSFVHFTCGDDSFLLDYHLPVNQVVYLPDPGSMNLLFKNIYMESLIKQEHYEKQIDALMQQLLILFSRQMHIGPKEDAIDAGIYEQFKKARMEILTHIEKEWTADSMAALTNLGRSQFYRYYKRFFNRSPKSELLDARIERAKYLIRMEQMPVSQAGELTGFRSQSHFTRYFSKNCGMTPSEYGKLDESRI